MKTLIKALLFILIAGLLYLLAAAGLQKVLLYRLEKSADIHISGVNRSPFSMGAVHIENLEINKKNDFHISAGEAWIHFSPFETLLGQIPLTVVASDLRLETDDAMVNSIFKDTPIQVLNAKITVFSGKGIAVHDFKMDGSGIHFEAEGKLLNKGKGNSDLKAFLSVDPQKVKTDISFLQQDLFSKNSDSSEPGKPLEFRFHLSGDMEQPVISLDSDLIRFNIREKEEEDS